MERLVLAGVLAALAAALAFVIQRRRPDTAALPRTPAQSSLPSAVNLAELSELGLIVAADTEQRSASPASTTSASVSGDVKQGPAFVVFTEETCRTCAAALDAVRGPAGAGLPVIEVPFDAQRELHRRYRIDTVPTTLLVAPDGQVTDGWIGPVIESELAAALSRR